MKVFQKKFYLADFQRDNFFNPSKSFPKRKFLKKFLVKMLRVSNTWYNFVVA